MRGVWPWLVGAVLVAFGAVSILVGATNALRPEQSQDLAPVFKAARLWLAGADPYQRIGLDAWRLETGAADAPDAPNGPDQSTIYSPIAVMDVALVSTASWLATKRIWLALNLALALYVPWLLRRLWYARWPGALAAVAFGLWMGGMGLRIGLGNGQHALYWLSLILTACALASSWPRAAGIVLAWSVHKFNLTAIVAPYFLARRAFLTVASAMVALAVALVAFLAWSQAPAAQIAASYAREFSWLFAQSHGGTLPGRGVTDLYSILAVLAGDGRVASVLAFVLAAAGLIATALATSHANRQPRDVDLAAWILLLLWTTYHRAYDTVLLVAPLAVLIDRAWRSGSGWRTWHRVGPVAALALMWYVDPSKVYLLVHPTALDRLPADGSLMAIETIYRLGVLGCWAYLVAMAARERGTARDAVAIQASPAGPDKTSGVVCVESRRRLAAVVAEGVTA